MMLIIFLILHAGEGICRQFGDTLVLGETQSSFRIDRESPYVVMPFAIEYQKLTECKSLFLSFDDILLETVPEGDYEVYLVDSLPGIGALDPASHFFVQPISVRGMPVRVPGRQLMDAGVLLSGMQRESHRKCSYCLVIIFRGRGLPDHSFSREAGVLRSGTVRLISISD